MTQAVGRQAVVTTFGGLAPRPKRMSAPSSAKDALPRPVAVESHEDSFFGHGRASRSTSAQVAAARCLTRLLLCQTCRPFLRRLRPRRSVDCLFHHRVMLATSAHGLCIGQFAKVGASLSLVLWQKPAPVRRAVGVVSPLHRPASLIPANARTGRNEAPRNEAEGNQRVGVQVANSRLQNHHVRIQRAVVCAIIGSADHAGGSGGKIVAQCVHPGMSLDMAGAYPLAAAALCGQSRARVNTKIRISEKKVARLP